MARHERKPGCEAVFPDPQRLAKFSCHSLCCASCGGAWHNVYMLSDGSLSLSRFELPRECVNSQSGGVILLETFPHNLRPSICYVQHFQQHSGLEAGGTHGAQRAPPARPAVLHARRRAVWPARTAEPLHARRVIRSTSHRPIRPATACLTHTPCPAARCPLSLSAAHLKAFPRMHGM